MQAALTTPKVAPDAPIVKVIHCFFKTCVNSTENFAKTPVAMYIAKNEPLPTSSCTTHSLSHGK